MTVTGNVTASVATASYTPPFKYVTSYAQAPLVTGTVSGTASTATTTGNPDPSVSPTATGATAYASAYLDAHMMSQPSYRYAYLFWMVVAFIACVYAFCHHTRLSGGSLGAWYTKWGVRRLTLGRKSSRRSRALPSNSVLLVLAIFVAVVCVLSLVGADYIAPSSSTLNFATSFKRRDSSSSPTYTITKALWTTGSRFGFMAFALTPLVVLVALKSPPVAFFSLPFFTYLYSDKLAVFHRAGAWLLWALTTAHVALWTVQLFKDYYNGRAVWFIIWSSYRFIFGCVAYAAMTALMVLSQRPIRKNGYEFFYAAHVILVILTLVFALLHHPVLWYWMAAALGIWALERGFRAIRMGRINGLFGSASSTGFIASQPYTGVATTDEYNLHEFTDKTLPRLPDQSDTPPFDEFGEGGRRGTGYYADGSIQSLGTYDSRYSNEATYSGTRNGRDTGPRTPPRHSAMAGGSIATLPTPSFQPLQSVKPPPVPVGYAQAQLLPSRTVRLTIRTARPLRWSPGQSVLLYLPDLSRTQSHPFTILNGDDPSEIVLLIKARKGITRRLYHYVKQRSRDAFDFVDKQNASGPVRTVTHATPIYVRTWIDGPLGSASRVRWGQYSTVLIICGGSGVSFGASVCSYLCDVMAKGDFASKTRRVRFCWVVREYAEIAWVAAQLCRCKVAVDGQLQIDIFVTNPTTTSTRRNVFSPPKPTYAHDPQRDSISSDISGISSDGGEGDTAQQHYESQLEAEANVEYSDIVDLTNYEDEEDVDDPAERQLSQLVQQQGKLRRAKTRKAIKTSTSMSAKRGTRGGRSTPSTPPRHPLPLGGSPSRGGSLPSNAPEQFLLPRTSYPPGAEPPALRPPSVYATEPQEASGSTYPPRRTQPTPNYDPFKAGEKYTALGGSGTDYDPSLRGSIPFEQQRWSTRSLAESTYDRYDPYRNSSLGQNMGPSPTPSMYFDDGESIRYNNALSRSSRTGSMMLLEDDALDPLNRDDALWIDEADHAAMVVMAERARHGRPTLATVLEEEIALAQGSIMVTTCGPSKLNTVVRQLVSRNISPKRMRHGDRRGHIAIYSEDYES